MYCYTRNLTLKHLNMISPLKIVLFLIQFSTILGAVPNLSQKCKLSDSACIKTVAQAALPTIVAGMPELGTEPLDVMHIEKNKVELAGLKLSVTDAYITGLKNAVIKNINFDMAKKMLMITYQADTQMKSKYKASGQLLVLPIDGDGDMAIDLKNLNIEMIAPFEVVKNNDGKDTLELKSYQFKYDVKGGARFDLTNLFNGNKQLSKTLLTFMNDNWKTLSEEFGRPMLEKLQKKIFEVLKTYFLSQPLQEFVEN